MMFSIESGGVRGMKPFGVCEFMVNRLSALWQEYKHVETGSWRQV